MMFASTVAVLLLSSPAFAFPWLAPGGMDRLLNHPDAQKEIRRQLGGRSMEQKREVNGVMDPVLGLIPTNDAVKGLMRFPEDDHPFIPPGPTDQRGPCPGLNTMANHGYIPRNGIVVLNNDFFDACLHLWNLAPEVTSIFSGVWVEGGDLTTLKLSIGGPDNRVSPLGGVLNPILGTPSGAAGHGKFIESDASATRNDFYMGGDDSTFQPALFQQLHQRALEQGNGTYNLAAIQEHFKRRYADSKTNNPKFYFNAPSGLATLGAYYLILAGFSNGTYLDGTGIPNEASITSFYGAQPTRPGAWSDPNLTYTRVPERIPPGGWYRRGIPITLTEAVSGILAMYLYAQPQLGGNDANGAWVAGPVMLPTTPDGLACFWYNAIYANFPSEFFGIVGFVVQVVNFLGGLLQPGYQAIGCSVQPPATNPAYETWSETYVGKAKENAVGSGWYHL